MLYTSLPKVQAPEEHSDASSLPRHGGQGSKTGRLKGVVLGGNLLDEVVADEGKLRHDVVAHLGHVAEEEEGEDSGGNTEAGSSATTIQQLESVTGCLE